MQELETFKLIERISNLLRSEERRKYAAIGLQPVHGQVLDYLNKCNEYSNTLLAVAEFLGLTKGTVSQSIQLLERKGYLTKSADPHDGRVFHLYVTASGLQLLEELKPLDVFQQAEQRVSAQEYESISEALRVTLGVLQKANQTKSFGVCRSCRFIQIEEHHYQCQLTEQPLKRDDTAKICKDHVLAPDPLID